MKKDCFFSGEKAHRLLKGLAVDIGPRESGSPGERRAAEWILGEFQKMGLEARLQEFRMQTGRVTRQRLEVTAPWREEIPCMAMPLMGGTGGEGVEGELIHVEQPTEEYVTADVEGRIVLTQGFYRKGADLFRRHRPLAILNVGSRPGVPLSNMWGVAAVRDKYGAIPTVSILYEDGFRLIEKEAKRLRLVVEVEAGEATSQNVVAELPGTDRRGEIVVIGGHYDTVPGVAGAADNGAGTATVMELARVFKKRGSRRTLRFVAFGSEETSMEGSECYVKELRRRHEEEKKRSPEEPSELERTRLMVNVDVQGGLFGKNTAAPLGPPELAASVRLLAREEGLAFSVGSGEAISGGVYSSDNASFSSAGVPSLAFIRGGGAGIHAVSDEFKWILPGPLAVTGKFIERWMARCLDAEVFPFDRVIPDSDRKALEGFYKDKMKPAP